MDKEMVMDTKMELGTRTALWRGVITRTIEDWLDKPLRAKQEAERYLFQDSPDLSMVCASAGISISKLRTCLNKVRGQSLGDVLALAS